MIPLEIPTGYFCGKTKLIQKLIWKVEDLKRHKITLKKENKETDITLLHIKY